MFTQLRSYALIITSQEQSVLLQITKLDRKINTLTYARKNEKINLLIGERKYGIKTGGKKGQNSKE